MSGVLSVSGVFVAVLSVVSLAVPSLFLYKMARERRLFERMLRR
ncbi:hypothetical protein [Natronomonas sp.]|nr:hypothetical protein [Natronomonas sp.]